MPDRQQSEELEGDDDDGTAAAARTTTGWRPTRPWEAAMETRWTRGPMGTGPRTRRRRGSGRIYSRRRRTDPEVSIDGLPRDITEEALREVRDPLGEIYEVRGFFLAWYFCIASQLVTWNLMLVFLCDERMNDK